VRKKNTKITRQWGKEMRERERLLFRANSAIFQLYHGKNKFKKLKKNITN
jgi:hypothetical protein